MLNQWYVDGTWMVLGLGSTTGYTIRKAVEALGQLDGRVPRVYPRISKQNPLRTSTGTPTRQKQLWATFHSREAIRGIGWPKRRPLSQSVTRLSIVLKYVVACPQRPLLVLEAVRTEWTGRG